MVSLILPIVFVMLLGTNYDFSYQLYSKLCRHNWESPRADLSSGWKFVLSMLPARQNPSTRSLSSYQTRIIRYVHVHITSGPDRTQVLAHSPNTRHASSGTYMYTLLVGQTEPKYSLTLQLPDTHHQVRTCTHY